VEAAVADAVAGATPPPLGSHETAADAAASEAAKTKADAAAMRTRMLRDLPPEGPWDVKLRPGGQVEVEFIAQTLQLVHARAVPQVCHPTTREALRRLAAAGALPEEDTALLVQADHVWRTVQGLLRITVGRDARTTLPDASARALLRAANAAGVKAVGQTALRGRLEQLAKQVRTAFVRHIGVLGT